MSLSIELDLVSVLDKVEKIKISSQYAKRFNSIPSPFCDKSTELPNGTVGCWDSITIIVDDTIVGDIEIVWKEPSND